MPSPSPYRDIQVTGTFTESDGLLDWGEDGAPIELVFPSIGQRTLEEMTCVYPRFPGLRRLWSWSGLDLVSEFTTKGWLSFNETSKGEDGTMVASFDLEPVGNGTLRLVLSGKGRPWGGLRRVLSEKEVGEPHG